jgi:hypothetical protein
MSYSRRRVNFQDLLVTHPYEDGFTTIQTPSVDTDLRTREEPAHGQRFESSLAVPLLFPPYGHKIMGRHIRKRRPGLNVICVFNKPTGYGGFCCLTLCQSGLLRCQPERSCQLSIMRCPPSLHKVFYNNSVRSLCQCGFLHVISSLLTW